MRRYHVRDEESYRERLRRFLADPYLRFNPYRVSDSELIAAAYRQRWGSPFSLTQMAVVEFLPVDVIEAGPVPAEYVRYKICTDSRVERFSLKSFIYFHTAQDSLRPVKHTLNGRNICNADLARRLSGRRFFVSHAIPVWLPGDVKGVALRMHRLTGKEAADAQTIREGMIGAKLEMLGRLLEYPDAECYLDGEPSASVDIATPVNAAIAAIRRFPEATPPPSSE